MQVAEYAQVQSGTKMLAVAREDDGAYCGLLIQPLKAALQLIPHGAVHGIVKGDEISKLESIVRSEILSPTGCTPLYDAIYFACTLQPERRTRIVVVSDGSNDVPLTGGSPNHIYYSGKNRNKDAVLEEIKRSKASLYPHQFKNDRFFNQPGYEEVKAEAEKSNAELRQLLNELIKIGRASRNAFLYDDFDSMIKDLLASFPRSKVRILSDDTNARLIAEGKFGEEIIIPRQRVPFWAIAEVESMGDNKLQKQRARVLVTGNQKLELQYKSDSNELNYIEFSEERDANQYNIRFETSETGLNLWARPIPDPHGGSKRELILEVAVRGKSAESERRVFTTPPKFAVAQLKPSSGDTNRSYLLGDVNFVSGTHYPILRFPIVPWGINKELFSKQADFEVWIADELPRNAIRAQLEANGSADLLGGRVQCIRSNNVVKVIVKSNDDERVFVVCPDAKSSNRTYPDNLSVVEPGDERHEFELGETSGAPVEIAVLKLSDLKNSNSQVELKHFYFRNKGVSQ